MVNETSPSFDGNLRSLVSDDGSSTILEFSTAKGPIRMEVPTAMLTIIRRKVEATASQAEAKRRETDPLAGGQNDVVNRTAVGVRQHAVGGLEGTHGVAVSFTTAAGPETYFLLPEQAQDIADRIYAQLRGQGAKPPTAH